VTLGAAILRGFPPIGRGAFLRDRIITAPFGFRAVNASRADVEAMAADAKALGPTWLYSGPSAWAPANWRAELERIVALAVRLDVDGIIADPENGWTQQDEAEARALGAALRSVAGSTRVGITSFPGLPVLAPLADAVGDAAWGCVQIYGRASTSPAAFRAWWERWADVFGERLCLAIAGWVPSDAPELGSAEGFGRYLDSLPRSQAAIAWTVPEGMPEHIATALATYEPGGSGVLTLGRAAMGFVLRPAGAVLVVVLALVVAVVVAVVAWSARGA
jgi:hypothetical protein